MRSPFFSKEFACQVLCSFDGLRGAGRPRCRIVFIVALRCHGLVVLAGLKQHFDRFVLRSRSLKKRTP